MIAKLTGLLVEIELNSIIIDVQGVGYQLSCSNYTMKKLPKQGEMVTLYVETVVREDSFTLLGFVDKEEKTCFAKLTKVQGVGNRMALSLLSCFCPKQVYSAILSEDIQKLSQADGIGKKLAQRIILELKEKLHKEGHLTTSLPLGPLEDATLALIRLGYKEYEIKKIFANEQDPHRYSTQEWIKDALSKLAKKGSHG